MSSKQSFSTNKKNVLVISGTRAEFGLFESIIAALEKSAKFSPLLLLTGMHTLKKFGNTRDEVRDRGYEVSGVVPVSQDGDMILWLSEEIKGIEEFCRDNKVDCILVLGDRDEMLAGAIVGAHLGIPVGHIHGGEETGEGVVDSKNRNAITQLATFHFAATQNSASRISKMTDGGKNVFVVGAPGVDLFLKISKKSKDTVAKKFDLDAGKRWFLVVMHPTPLSKNLLFDDQIKPLVDSLSGVDEEIIWIYPNSDTGSDVFVNEIEKFSKRKSVGVYKNLARDEFVDLLSTVDLLIGNSSLGIIESAYFHLPVVNIGDRQKGRKRSTNVIDCDYNREEIKKAIEVGLSSEFKKKCQVAPLIYGEGKSGQKIVKILEEKL